IEKIYNLKKGYFQSTLKNTCRKKQSLESNLHHLSWYLPNDFYQRSECQKEEVISWIQRTIFSSDDEYAKNIASNQNQRYAINFPRIIGALNGQLNKEYIWARDYEPDPSMEGNILSPEVLETELEDFIRFKTSTLTVLGYQRLESWGQKTAITAVRNLGAFFGALVATPDSPIKGYGIPLSSISMGILIMPRVWMWFIDWRKKRRGFYSAADHTMIQLALSLSRRETGWLRQKHELAHRLQPIPGLISQNEIDDAQYNWEKTCDDFHQYALILARDIRRVLQTGRDRFHAILPILESECPLSEYLKIAEEILRLMPESEKNKKEKAEAVRSFLIVRLVLHLGVRQKNIRELLICPKGSNRASEASLIKEKRGEMRWNPNLESWEVFIPAIAFKNSKSVFFKNQPYYLIIPDVGGLYHYIDIYLNKYRMELLGNLPDPKTFFVNSANKNSKNASYCQTTFSFAWITIIRKYGIYNPYTGRGAIEGLLPHGPHKVRDVLATHILKKTGSYEIASYSIQDTPETIKRRYGRFSPHDKIKFAGRILDQIWTIDKDVVVKL
ncbi:MAG: hypothetical protein WBP45_07865, partial [Daejeonella sp.]